MKKLTGIAILAGAVALSGAALAGPLPSFSYALSYDGFVQTDGDTGTTILADTLIVVNNPNPFSGMKLWMEVWDKHGTFLWEGMLWNGGAPIDTVPADGFAWITLGMVLPRPTRNPMGTAGGEKFHYRITARHPDTTLRIVPTVEIKQVLYETFHPFSLELIWQAGEYKSWTETALGGNKYATGVLITDIP